MLEAGRGAALVAATVAVGLLAGLYLAFAYAVMPGLARAGDQAFVGAMQGINVAILNGWFFLVFFGAVAFPALAAVLHLGRGVRGVLPWIVAGSVLSVAGFLITVALNVPLNEQLDAAGPVDRIADPAAVRAAFETAWNRWNLTRGLITTAAFACLAWALVLRGRFT